MKKILLLTIIIFSVGHTDVISKMYTPYKPIKHHNYYYSYSYSNLININSYSLKYFTIKKEHKKVVKLLKNANKTINNLEYQIEMLKKDVKYWKRRNRIKTSVTDKRKKEEAIKKMRMNWKSN